jgi:hypothetical protein
MPYRIALAAAEAQVPAPRRHDIGSFIVILVAAWLLGFGASAAILADRHRRRRRTWAVFGAILGPVALAVLELAPPGRCWSCEAPTRGWLTTCQWCGQDVRGPMPQGPTTIRLDVPRGNALRGRLPVAVAVMRRLPSEVARIEGGRTRVAAANLASATRRTREQVRRASRSAVATGISTRSAVTAGLSARRRAPEGPQAMTAALSARRARAPEGPPPTPVWPTLSPDSSNGSPLRPATPVGLRLQAIGATSVIEAEAPEPTHECAACHREVPDSARFCRMCGHVQR